MSSKKLILLFLLSGVVFAAWETKNYLELSQKGHLVLAMPQSAASILSIVAFEKGFFQQYGIDAKIRYVGTGSAAIRCINKGEADFATLTDWNVAVIGLDHVSAKVLCTLEKSYKPAILARKDRGITKAEHLHGKRIGVLSGSSSQIFLERFLNKRHIEGCNLRFKMLYPMQLQAELMSGANVDAIVLWEPYISNIKMTLGDRIMIFKDEPFFNSHINLVGCSDFLKENKDIVHNLLQAYIDAELFIKLNKAESADIIARALKINKAAVEREWDSYLFYVNLDRALLEATIVEGYWGIIHRGGYRDRTLPDYRDYFAPQYLTKAYKDRVAW